MTEPQLPRKQIHEMVVKELKDVDREIDEAKAVMEKLKEKRESILEACPHLESDTYGFLADSILCRLCYKRLDNPS